MDSQTKSQTDDAAFWNDEAGVNRLAVLDGLLGVTVGKYATIAVEVRELSEKPALMEDASHVVEASLRLDSGLMEVRNCTNFDLELGLTLSKGTYRVRISSFELDSVVNDEGNDYYIVEVWKSRAAKTKILKNWVKKTSE